MAFKLKEIVEITGGEVIGDDAVEIESVARIEEAREGQIAFLANLKYSKYLSQTGASAIIVPKDVSEVKNKSLLCVEDPYYAFLQVLNIFHPPKSFIEKGIHASAVIDSSAELSEDLSIGPFVYIGKGCRIGKRSVLMPGVVMYDDVVIGEDCLIHANVCLREKVRIGDRVILHNGVVVGGDGFGFAPKDGKYHKIPQVGTVVIENDVEIGANTTIDRATLGETRIYAGAKLDNLIQVGHNCTVGENTVIAAQTGLSGSTHIGKGVRVGGQAGFAGHLTVGDGAAVGAQSGVSKSVPPGQMVFGYPARPHMEAMRIDGALRRLPKLIKEMKELRESIKKLEQDLSK
jgi:UDP-3-O-[3-hydroxymyristoyl] glucosamine N-acyltransferase